MSATRLRRFIVGLGLGLVIGGAMVAAVALVARPSTSGADRAELIATSITTRSQDDSAPGSTSTTARPMTTTLPPAGSTTTTTTTTTTLPLRAELTAPAWTVARPWGSVEGVTMFRGNPTRTYYGSGPVPEAPEVRWRYPDAPMCGASTHRGEPKTWCGTGWTGQPVVWERPDGVTEIIFGSYDKSVHFVDAASGVPLREPFAVGDIVKGSPTLDPDGYPLLYFGARDNKLRIVALDRGTPTELWSYDAYNDRVVWNDDWDSNPLIVDDVMFEGGENGWFYGFRLNRSYDDDGLVRVEPETLLKFPAFTEELLATVGRELSIENSVAMYDSRVYFANSGGRIVGIDVSEIEGGVAPVVLDYWVGDDVDATITIDGDGMLYVAAELERFNSRAADIGQFMKLDPTRPDDPLAWSLEVPPVGADVGGVWATPALARGVVYLVTHPGEILAVDTADGSVLWRDAVGYHAWSSPVVVDDRLVVAVDCSSGGALRSYDVTDPRKPKQIWEVRTDTGCIESTPVVWKGAIYVGSRDGYFYAFSD